jgi:hypothetical protein
MVRWRSLVCGALAFAVAHWLEAATWRERFMPGGEYPPWFLNSGRAVVFTAAVLFIAAASVGARTRGAIRDALLDAGNLTAGALAAMIVVLAVSGPGTIFPIALAIGTTIAAVAAVAGALAGSLLARVLRR